MALQYWRIYGGRGSNDGLRVLVDRLWPRGPSTQAAAVDLWMREIAPSDALRKWFGHDPAKWPDFQDRYGKELESQPEAVGRLRTLAQPDGDSLVCGQG